MTDKENKSEDDLKIAETATSSKSTEKQKDEESKDVKNAKNEPQSEKEHEDKKVASAVEIGTKLKKEIKERNNIESALAKSADRATQEKLYLALQKSNHTISKLVGEARGKLTPELETQIQESERKLKESKTRGETLDLEAEKRKAESLEDQGNGLNPIQEVAGMVLGEYIRETEKSQRQSKLVKETAETTVDPNRTWLKNQEELEAAKNAGPDAADAESASEQKIRMARLLAEEKALLDKGLHEDPNMREDQAKLDALMRESKAGNVDPNILVARIEEVVRQAAGSEKIERSFADPNAGRRLARARREADHIEAEILSHDPKYKEFTEIQRQLDDRLAALLTNYDSQEHKDIESLMAGGKEIGLQRKAAENQYARQIWEQNQQSPDGRRMYDPLPNQEGNESKQDYENRLEDWVWEKIKAIDSASISPASLNWSPKYTSLLYALTEPSLPIHLKNNINAWRSSYEMGLIWDMAGRPEDVLSRAADIDHDVFMGLLGQYKRDANGLIERDKEKNPIFTDKALKLQKAFALLEEHGRELTRGTKDNNFSAKAEDKLKIYNKIIEKLNEGATNDKDKFGTVLFRIAYRHWRFLGREGIFDEVMAKVDSEKMGLREKGFTAREDIRDKFGEIVYKKGEFIKDGSLVPVCDQMNELIMRKSSDRRYDSYSLSSVKFWWRRLFDGLYQEKRIKFLPQIFKTIEPVYGVKDYLSDKVIRIPKEEEKPEMFDRFDNIKKITADMLKKADWENKTGVFPVWVDDIRKAAATRAELIKPGGILETPDFPGTRALSKLKEIMENDADPQNNNHPKIIDAFIAAHKRETYLGIFPRGLRIRSIIDSEGKKSWLPDFVGMYSEIQKTTGLPYRALSRDDIQERINNAMMTGFISREAAENLKRKWLGFLGIPGYGPIRAVGNLVEATPGTLLAFLFGLFFKFFESALPGEVSGGKKR